MYISWGAPLYQIVFMNKGNRRRMDMAFSLLKVGRQCVPWVGEFFCLPVQLKTNEQTQKTLSEPTNLDCVIIQQRLG